MARKIECVESDDKTCPKGMRWQRAYRRRLNATDRTPEYMVRWDKGHLNTGTSHCDTLTQARKEARALVAEGRAWAEVFRWAENGVQMRRVHICSYEVAIECGSEVA